MNCLRFSGSAMPGDVLGRDRGAADHEDVGPGVEDGLVVADGPLRRQPCRRRHPGGPDLLDPPPDQVILDRLGIDLLQPPGGRVVIEVGDFGEQRLWVVEPGPETLEVEHGQAAEAANLDRGRGRDDAVHGRNHQRQLEPVGVDLPGDRHLFRVPGATGRHDADLVERVGAAAALPAPDLHWVTSAPTRPGPLHRNSAPR